VLINSMTPRALRAYPSGSDDDRKELERKVGDANRRSETNRKSHG
jgi:hypothetical protein